ncbi:hypothetical protein RSK60_800017 [Ralstonia solanacearum K60]|nr:hypothetical protein RSK60_800017 [Ralstonia solanacearum K60]
MQHHQDAEPCQAQGKRVRMKATMLRATHRAYRSAARAASMNAMNNRRWRPVQASPVPRTHRQAACIFKRLPNGRMAGIPAN